MQTRNSDPVEAYTVSVYTLWPNGEIDKCLVGFENVLVEVFNCIVRHEFRG